MQNQVELEVKQSARCLSRRLSAQLTQCPPSDLFALIGYDEQSGFHYVFLTGAQPTGCRFAEYLSSFESLVLSASAENPKCMLIDLTHLGELPNFGQLMAKVSQLGQLRSELAERVRASVFLTPSDTVRKTLEWLLHLVPPQNPYCIDTNEEVNVSESEK